jgi:hypothetical protein
LVFDVLPHFKKVYYFSDGASSQYKDCRNFLNLCYHAEEFHVAAEWNFIYTSHGKNPCNGIGGTAKQHVAHVSSQATERNHILTTEYSHQWAKENITGITFFYMKKIEHMFYD